MLTDCAKHSLFGQGGVCNDASSSPPFRESFAFIMRMQKYLCVESVPSGQSPVFLMQHGS